MHHSFAQLYQVPVTRTVAVQAIVLRLSRHRDAASWPRAYTWIAWPGASNIVEVDATLWCFKLLAMLGLGGSELPVLRTDDDSDDQLELEELQVEDASADRIGSTFAGGPGGGPGHSAYYSLSTSTVTASVTSGLLLCVPLLPTSSVVDSISSSPLTGSGHFPSS